MTEHRSDTGIDSPESTDHGNGQASDAPASNCINGNAEITCTVVGIGASAGGLEALASFFDHLPGDTGMAFVIVQHLSPGFRSLMDELLARHTKIPIHRVEDGMVVKPNAIYLIPPRKEMIISGGRLLLTDKDPAQGLTLPIDTFFRSLAQDAGARAVGIVLSGTGSDGSRGIRAIHEAGGLVFAQNEATAKFDGMPRSAMETGIVDFVMSPEEMPAALVRYAQPGADRGALALPQAPVVGEAIHSIIRLLRDEHGIDFSHYKPTTVMRRIERRLQLNQSNDLEDYLHRLQHDSGEVNSLYRDLLIGVTKFFRDREAFERLERDVVPSLLTRTSSDEELRIWVAACATGEEAYSLAILLHERFQLMGRRPSVKIFATDVHRTSLEFASTGIYSEASLSEVGPQRLSRYFVRQGANYQVSQELRKMIVFAPHNLIKDAPFTKMDLITCRNLLIYFQPQTQRKVLSLLHFGLRMSGVLFLGPSESPGEIADEFDTIDEHWKIYRKRRDVRLPAELRPSLPAPGMLFRPAQAGSPSPTSAELPLMRAYDALLTDFMPPAVLINDRGEVVHTFGGAGKYLTPRDGRPTLYLLDLVHRDLKLPLTGALQRSQQDGVSVTFTGVQMESAAGNELLKLSVKPLAGRGAEAGYTVVLFEEMVRPTPPPAGQTQYDAGQVSLEHLRALEEELSYTKENLQATVEEMETSNEELQATNEELVASNEELQSTNEELHSVNEELYTVNAEYQRKIVELTELTDDMDNLLRSTDICVLFLDEDYCIRKFTPAATRLFQIMPQDLGRRIDTFVHNIDYPQLLDEVAKVLRGPTVIEREVRDRSGGWHLMRILPYRTRGRTDGAVLTLVDISQLKKTSEELRLMSKVFMDSADAIIIEDLDGAVVNLNAETERAYGYRREELIGQSVSILVPPEQLGESQTLRQRCRNTEHVRNIEGLRRRKSGETLPVLLTLSLLTDEQGKPLAIASIAKDIRERKAVEADRERYAAELEQTNQTLRENVERRRRAEEEARDGLRRRDHFLAMLSHELRNPLAAILNATYVMDTSSPEENACQDALHVIQRQSRQMARLLDDLLDVSRITQGKIEVRKERVELNQSVRDAVESVRSIMDARGHTVTLDLGEQPLYVDGDPARLLQIQENLLTNAAKYTPPEGNISISLQADGAEAVLRVSDTGEGIPESMIERVFDLFVQSTETLDRSQGGMGVGLTLVRNLVALHGGTVQAFSEGPGKGSQFEVRLPLRPDRSIRPAPKQVPSPSGHGLRVLLVEDNDDSRCMLRLLLLRDGYDVHEAEDGLSGLDAVERVQPDVAILDIGLPGIDGYELARRIRRKYPSNTLFLVALTGYGQDSDRRAVQDAGFDAHLVKPLKRDQLMELLKTVHSRRTDGAPQ